jgi:hypothetical protein
MTRQTWERVVRGFRVRRVEPQSYEGERFTEVWSFNAGGYGQLEVTYDDGAQAFNGSLGDAVIRVERVLIKWSDPPSGHALHERERGPGGPC